LGIVSCLLLVLVWGTRQYRAPIVFSKEDCDHLRPGLRREEVEQILGGPAGDYSTGECLESIIPIYESYTYTWWTSEWGDVGVDCDSDGKLHKVVFCPVVKTRARKSDLLDHFLRWFRGPSPP